MDVTVLSTATARPTSGPRVFDDPALPADRELVRQLAEATSRIDDLAAPPVVLPDFHHKSKMEMPSSIAVATRGTVRPTLTSSSVNCGMALIALECDRPDERAVGAFYRAVRERYPYPTRGARELTRAETIEAAVDGARFAARRWGVDPSELERVEESGRIDLDAYGGADRLRKEVPWLTWELGRLRFGTVGPTNHFIELQVVEEVFDPAAAEQLGVREGQLTLNFHAGGGVLTGEMGHLFGRRKDYPRQLKLAMALQKPLFHLASARSVEQVRLRTALYFGGDSPPVDLHSDEGQRLMLANAAAMNYGFAFRTATYAALQRLAVDTFGGSRGRLVVDSPHNSIYEEQVGGESAVVHRHNSCRAFPADRMPVGSTFASTGQAVLLPGTHRTSSYLCVTGGRSQDSLHSACHGAGTVVQQLADCGRSGSDPQHRSTLRFRYDDAEPTRVAHLDDVGVDAALGVLRAFDLARPVARMRPLAVLH